MKYIKYTINTTCEAEDVIVGTLYDLGIEGAQIEDKTPLTEEELAGMFVDIPLIKGEDDGMAQVSFFLDADEDNEELLKRVREELDDISTWMEAGPLTITSETTEDVDYLNNWKQYFKQFHIDDILFIPSWEDIQPDEDAGMVIHIDPGTAFGTGKHETTQLCIKALRDYVTEGCSMLDIGTGSGILAIMAYKFGAMKAVGTDLDVCAIDAVKDNFEANGLADAGFELVIGNIIDNKEIQDEVGYGKYDIVAANILAEVLIPLTPQVKEHIKPGGIYITSGIIDDKEEIVAKTIRDAGFEILRIDHLGEWVGIVARANEVQ